MARSLALLLASSILFAAGCARGNAGPARLSVHPVDGKLVVADRPAAGARLAFHPVGTAAARPVGVTGPDGAFRLTTYSPEDGAPEGEYVVTVLWPNETFPPDECDIVNPANHDRLGGLYLDPAKSELRATVRPGPNKIALYATVGGGKGWNLPPLGGAGKKDDRPPSELDLHR